MYLIIISIFRLNFSSNIAILFLCNTLFCKYVSRIFQSDLSYCVYVYILLYHMLSNIIIHQKCDGNRFEVLLLETSVFLWKQLVNCNQTVCIPWILSTYLMLINKMTDFRNHTLTINM